MKFDIEKNSLFKEIKQDEYLSLPIFNSHELPYHEFFERFLLTNLPCVIKGVTDNWEASIKWITDTEPNIEYLAQEYGHTKVMIYDCSDRYFNSQKCRNSHLSEYIQYWKNRKNENNLYYLKDWHLKQQVQTDNFYEVPVYFASDWLNEYLTECSDDDYRFVYMGPKGTWTPFHADVFNSYSWSVNVCGKKRWILCFPGDEISLRDKLNNLPYDVSDILPSKNYVEVIQNPGEALFIPSGWYHQVWNMEDSISLNHNWINGCNLLVVWKCLESNCELVRKEISDCDDMDNFEEHCQIMLKAVFGMNYEQFYEFLKFIAQRRLSMMENDSVRAIFNGHTIGTNHIIFDLQRIENVLEHFLNCNSAPSSPFFSDGQCLFHNISQTLKSHQKVEIKE